MTVETQMPTILVMAKAPVAGLSKTRLAATVGNLAAARLAAAALLDTLAACTAAAGPERCVLALAGAFEDGVQAEALQAALAGWRIFPQAEIDFAGRLAHAHAQVEGPRLQVGMDTPQLTVDDLARAAAVLSENDAVLGPADDGGWWLLGLHEGSHAAALHGVPMSQDDTGALTGQALARHKLSVGVCHSLRDVDTAEDAQAVAELAPGLRFAQLWYAAARQRVDN